MLIFAAIKPDTAFVPPEWLATIYDIYDHFDGLILFVLGFAAAQIVALTTRRRERAVRDAADTKADEVRRRDLARGKADETATAAETLERQLTIGLRSMGPEAIWYSLAEPLFEDVRRPLRYLTDAELRRDVDDALGQIRSPMTVIDWGSSTQTPTELQRQAAAAIVDAIAAYIREDSDKRYGVRLSNIATRHRTANKLAWEQLDEDIAKSRAKEAKAKLR
jgi:hypothetical protein